MKLSYKRMLPRLSTYFLEIFVFPAPVPVLVRYAPSTSNSPLLTMALFWTIEVISSHLAHWMSWQDITAHVITDLIFAEFYQLLFLKQ